MPEDDLLSGVARGEPDWNGIFRAYAPDVRAAALKVLRGAGRVVDSKDVDDVVQTTFEEAMQGGVLPKDTKSIAARLRRVATRRAIDALRRAGKVDDEGEQELAALTVADETDELVDADFDHEVLKAVWRNQRQLEGRERLIFRAHAIDGESFADIGNRIGLTGQRVGQIYKEAMRRIVRGIDLTGGDGGGKQ